MKLIFTFAMIAILILSLGSCKNDSDTIDNYDYSTITTIKKLDSFSRIEIKAPIVLNVEQGNSFQMTYDGDSAAYNNLVFEVEDDQLTIYFKNDLTIKKSPNVSLVIPTLKGIEIDGSSIVDVNDFTEQTSLELAIDGSGSINLQKFEGIEQLDISIDGSGNIDANKEIESIDELCIEIEGSGNVNADKIESIHCEVSIEGAGNATVHVSNQLDVEIEGVGNVTYSGTPTITKTISGLGAVHPK